MDQKVSIDCRNSVALITINNVEHHNALSREVMIQLISALHEIAIDTSIRAVVLTGAGNKSFCVGLDLKELTEQGKVVIDGNNSKTMGIESPLVKAFTDLPQPIIAAINGFAVTGGFELALLCDFLVCSTRAKFADTHALVGLLPGWGLSQKLARLIGLNQAKEISFTGRYIDASEALSLGLVNHVFEPEALVEEALNIAKRISLNEPVALQKIKAMMDNGSQLTLGEALKMEGDLAQKYNDELNFSHLEERLNELRAIAKK